MALLTRSNHFLRRDLSTKTSLPGKSLMPPWLRQGEGVLPLRPELRRGAEGGPSDVDFIAPDYISATLQRAGGFERAINPSPAWPKYEKEVG